MAAETKLRETITATLNKARVRVRQYTGLYATENLVGEVLAAFDEVLQWIETKENFKESRRAVQHACHELVRVAADRRTQEGGSVIARCREDTLEALDMFQADVFKRGTSSAKAQHLGYQARDLPI
jgi:uncharacterized protein (DUF2384 family)